MDHLVFSLNHFSLMTRKAVIYVSAGKPSVFLFDSARHLIVVIKRFGKVK